MSGNEQFSGNSDESLNHGHLDSLGDFQVKVSVANPSVFLVEL
jgi:hypothetical protein